MVPTVKAMAISEITGDFNGIVHSINAVFLVLIAGVTRAITVGSLEEQLGVEVQKNEISSTVYDDE